MKTREIDELVRWITSAAKQLKYGDVTVELTVHDGQIRKIVRRTSQAEMVKTESAPTTVVAMSRHEG